MAKIPKEKTPDTEKKPKKKRKKPKVKVLSTYQLMQRFPDEQAAIDYLTPISGQMEPSAPTASQRT